jgi:YD repeat-containing protein
LKRLSQRKGAPGNPDDGFYSYDPAHPHAVASYRGNSYRYDPNGNMTSRTVDGIAYTLTYDAENRLKSVTQGGQTTTFTYDGGGQRVMRDTVTGTIVYVGSHYEVRFEEGDMPQDLNDDCVINIVDIMLVAARWGMTEADPDWDSRYDFDGDGEITVADIMRVAVRWRETCTTVRRPAC